MLCKSDGSNLNNFYEVQSPPTWWVKSCFYLLMKSLSPITLAGLSTPECASVFISNVLS